MANETAISENKNTDIASLIIAAGGILERVTSHGPEIAVVYRERYGSEWSLPKGKVLPGESYVEAACREVKEETGYSAAIRRFAGSSQYCVEETPKIVLYWLMEAGEGRFEPTEEVRKVEWLSPEKAIELLTHNDQKTLLAQVYSLESKIAPRSVFDRMKVFFGRAFAPTRWRRLASDISTFREELSCLHQETTDLQITCINAARQQLAMAETALVEGDIDKGWKHFQAAQRMELLGLHSKDQIRAKAHVLREETTKLRGWRRVAAQKLLGVHDDLPSAEHLYEAALLLHEHYGNQAYKGALLRYHAVTLVSVLAVLLGFLMWMVISDSLPLPGPEYKGGHVKNSWLVIAVGLFGLLGGTISGITSVPKSIEATRIPELTSTIRVTMLRLFMGFASALIIYFFLKSELARVFLTGVFSESVADAVKIATPYTIYVISFCAGFSERLVLRAVEYVAGKQQ